MWEMAITHDVQGHELSCSPCYSLRDCYWQETRFWNQNLAFGSPEDQDEDCYLKIFASIF